MEDALEQRFHVQVVGRDIGEATVATGERYVLMMHAGPHARGVCELGPFLRERGDLDVLPPGSVVNWYDEDPTSSLVVSLEPELLYEARRGAGLRGELGIAPRHRFRDTQLEHLAWAMTAESSSGFPNGRLYLDSLALALSLRLLHGYVEPFEDALGFSRRQLRRVTRYIEEHLGDDLSLATLSALLDMSTSHFSALFKRSMNLPVHKYVIQRRVERAKMLLLEATLPASQIALEAGFAHQSHMARSIRNVLGLTPKELAVMQIEGLPKT